MPATKRPMDFTNVKESGLFNPKRKPAGDYVMKIVSVDDHTSKDGNDGWVFTCVVATEAKSARPATYPYYCGSDEKQAWKIRKLFIACGKEVPKKRVLVNPNLLLNKTFGAVLDDDEYEGRLKSQIVETMPVDDVEPNDEDDDQYEEEVEEAPRKRTAKKAATRKRAPEPEDDDEEEEEEEPAPRRRAAKKAPARKAARRPADDEDDDDEDVDELDLDEL